MHAQRLTLLLLLGGCSGDPTLLEIGKTGGNETGLSLDSGLNPTDSGLNPQDSGEVPLLDEDGDGFTADEDCDDSNAAINPDATEICDGVDNDCDGTIDQNAEDVSTWYADEDGDGFGNADDPQEACDTPDDFVSDNTDCNDDEARIFPGAEEVCDGLDNDCSGQTDEEACTDCTQVSYQDHTYQFCADTKTWTDARDQCTLWGYSLTTIEDEAEDQMFNEYITRTEIGSAWIGLNDRGEENEGNFTWVSGLESSYVDGWSANEPNSYGGNEDCVEKRDDFDWAWNDLRCDEEIAFICEGSF